MMWSELIKYQTKKLQRKFSDRNQSTKVKSMDDKLADITSLSSMQHYSICIDVTGIPLVPISFQKFNMISWQKGVLSLQLVYWLTEFLL